MPTCFKCHKNFPSIRDIWKHFKFAHELCAHSTFRCFEGGCARVFNNIKGYRRHWLLSHNHNSGLESKDCSSVCEVGATTASSTTQTQKLTVEIKDSISNNEGPLVNQNELNFSNVSSVELLLKNDVMQMIGQLYNMQSLPRSNVQTIISLMQSFMRENMERLHCHVKEKLDNLSVPMDVTSEALRALQSFGNAFDTVDTEYRRWQVLKDREWLHLPVPYVIGQRFKQVQSNADGHVQMSPIQVKAQFFPLRKIFKSIVELPNVYNSISVYMNKLKNEKNVISNFVQGSLWQNKIRHMADKEILPLFIFFDDYETGNPLGSHAGANKLGGVYVTIPCFPPEYQSTLNSIYHALLFYSNDRDEFGNAAVFRILIDELNFLEREGIELDLSPKKTVVYFKLGLLIGDNLGLHSMLGLVESFVANFACRFCKMDKAERATACVENVNLLRNIDTYDDDLLLNNVSLTGIKEKCVFLSLEDFHPYTNLMVDMMHDILEGPCDFDMIDIITYLIEVACYFTLEDLNSRLMSYDFGVLESRNRPPILSIQHLRVNSIRMTASEMWTFVRHFGLLCGDLVPENDPLWKFYLLLRQIIALLTSTSIQIECTRLLTTLIQEHHSLYIQLFKKHLKPKAYHMIHYPRILEASGPLVNLWCMRFEANHKPSKLSANISSSTRNVPATISVKQQLRLANALASKTIFSDTLEIGPGDYSSFEDLSLKFENVTDLNAKYFFVKWIKKYGTLYKPGMAVCIGDDDGTPEFAIIQYIIMQKEEIVFVCQGIETVFIHHIYAYEMCSKDFYSKLINLTNLLHHMPTHVTKMNGCEFLVIRSML